MSGKSQNQRPLKSNTSHTPIKSGIDKNGRPYIDMSDRNTAQRFVDQAPRFNKIKLGK